MLHPNDVNVNASILSLYIRSIVPRITRHATLALATRKRAQGVLGDNEFEDDGNYGSAATIDVEVLQAISRRVHYGAILCFLFLPINGRLILFYLFFCPLYAGKFVSESKFRSDPAAFIPHILKPNPEALAALITKPEVERKLLQRVRNKAKLYGQDLDPEGRPLAFPNGNESENTSVVPPSPGGFSTGKIDVEGVVELYEHYIIPLTKEVEVRQLTVFKL